MRFFFFFVVVVEIELVFMDVLCLALVNFGTFDETVLFSWLVFCIYLLFFHSFFMHL